MEEEKIKERLMEKQSNGRIACRNALKVAEEEGVSPALVGKLLNEMEIKIQACQLGCFT